MEREYILSRCLGVALLLTSLLKPGLRATGMTGPVEPLWAYGFDTLPQPGQKAAPQPAPSRTLRSGEPAAEQWQERHIAGSTAVYTLVDVRDHRNVVDWFPQDHPPMPPLLLHGPAARRPATWGCASCHLPNGRGRPENAPVGDLPPAYFVRQLQDFRDGRRRSADPRKPNTYTMIGLAQAMTPDEMSEAAIYFSKIPWTGWTRVVETDVVPKTRIVGNLFLPLESARTEPIAGRIIEVPENEEQSEQVRNPRSGFIAYVPRGSLQRGESLVKTGAGTSSTGAIVSGRTIACGTCHGPELRGLSDVPGIAGRSPSYIARQLYDFQQGTRSGASAALMQPVVANLDAPDLVAITAYIASLIPPAVPAAPSSQ